MKILPVNNTNIQPSQNLNFQCKTIYREIKYLPDIPCARCGRKVISSDMLKKAYTSIAKPLSFIMSKGPLNCWKQEPLIWNVLEKFQQDNPNKSLDEILTDGDNYKTLRDAAAGYAQKRGGDVAQETRNLLNNIITRSRTYLKSASVVMKRLASFKDYLDGNKKEAFEQFEIYSRKYPRKSISEILNIKDIYKYHQVKDLLQRAQTREKTDYHYENIMDMVKKANPNAAPYFAEIKETAMEIYASEDDPKARVYKVKELYTEALEKNGCEKLKDKVFNEIDQIPTTYITVDSFLTYAHNHGFSDIAFLYSLFNPYVSSLEHVIPSSKGGSDNLFNSLVMHRSCNLQRGNVPYDRFLEYHPEMPYNTQKQFDFVSKCLLDGKLTPDFTYWPIKTARTLNGYTDGKLNPDVSEYCKKKIKRTERNIEKNKKSIENLKDDRNSKIREKSALLTQISGLEDEIGNINSDVNKLEKEAHEDKAFLKNFVHSFESHKKNKKP